MTYLENQFSKSTDPSVKTLVQEQFVGKLAYITECPDCHNTSVEKEDYYELDLPVRVRKFAKKNAKIRLNDLGHSTVA